MKLCAKCGVLDGKGSCGCGWWLVNGGVRMEVGGRGFVGHPVGGLGLDMWQPEAAKEKQKQKQVIDAQKGAAEPTQTLGKLDGI